MDFGTCPVTGRQNEAYDTVLNTLVCPECVMFGRSVNHKVIRPEEAVQNMRDEFDKYIKKGLLKSEYTEGVLIDVREAINNVDRQKNQVLKEVETNIKELIKTLYERKDTLVDQIDSYFKEQRAKLEEKEEEWKEKQRIAEELLKLSSGKDSDEELLKNSE